MKPKVIIAIFIALIILFVVSVVLQKQRREQNLAASLNNNMSAFLMVIRSGESSMRDDAFTMLYGGGHFTDFSDHPRKVFSTPWGNTDAAGAFQFMAKVPGKVKTDTWDRIKRKLGLPDFSPQSQTIAAIELLRERGAYELILSGKFEQAILGNGKRGNGANWEWASLPGSPYGQPTKTMAQAKQVYISAGGQLA